MQLASAKLESGASIEEGCALLAGQVRENIALRRGYLIAAGPDGGCTHAYVDCLTLCSASSIPDAVDDAGATRFLTATAAAALV